MAGVADRAFREICVELGACYVVGEMASAKGMHYNSNKTAQLLGVADAERPMAVQLFGDEPEFMAKAAVMALAYQPDALDINMGCPAPKIAGGGSGSALLKSLPLAGSIIKAVSQAVEIPVTVKIRTGWDETSLNAVEAAVIAEENGAAAITVHGRTRAQMYAPPVNLDMIAQVKRAVSIPVIGNGDIDSVDAAINMYERTGCDLVMAGRGALGAPWLFAQIAAYYKDGTRLPPPEPDERMDIMLRHIRLACLYKGEHCAMREARKHAAYYLKALPHAAALRRQASQLTHYEDLEQLARAALDSWCRG